MNNRTAAAVPTIRHWRIELSDRADLVFSLRDYFRRLGLSAEVESPTVVELKTERRPSEIEQDVSEWARINETPLHLEEVREEARMLVPPPEGFGPPRLGQLLVGKGYITEEQLAVALTESRVTQDLLGVVLLREGLIFEDELARTLSEQLAVPYISIMRVGVDESVARMLPAEVGAAAAAIPVREKGESVQVAFADPTDPRALAAVGLYLPKISAAVAELSDIRLAWRGVTEVPGAVR
ncbi:MAG: type pilus assembly protein PilB [Actinomycetota bacterium]|nr:type pilus assembly protein PilB [Actinomycetota bacterium]